MSGNILQENSLYTDASSRASLIADKRACMDALLINFFGFLGLFKLSDSRGYMKNYETTEGKLMLNNIGDNNHDVSLSIKLAFEAGIILLPAVNNMTRLLSLIKTKQVKSADLDEQKVRDLLDAIMYKQHQPSPTVLAAISSFHTGAISLALLAKELYTLCRANKHLTPITTEFRNLVMKGQYGDFFNKLSTATNAPAAVTTTPVAPAAAQANHPTGQISTPQHGGVTRYTDTSPGHNKFWAAGVEGDKLFVVWGPIGSNTKPQVKTFADAAAASAELARLVKEKIGKGYKADGMMQIPGMGSTSATTVTPAPTAIKQAPQPVKTAPPQIAMGTTPEFFAELMANTKDVASMNNTFKKYGVAKSTFDMNKLLAWVTTNIKNCASWHQEKEGENFADNPLIKHLKTLSGYKTVVDKMQKAWVWNSFAHAVSTKNVTYFTDTINVREFANIASKSDFWEWRSSMRADFGDKVHSLLLSHLKDLVRRANSVAELEPAKKFLQKWRENNMMLGSNWMTVGNTNSITWEEPKPSAEAIMLMLGLRYLVNNRTAEDRMMSINFTFKSTAGLNGGVFTLDTVFNSLVDPKFKSEVVCIPRMIGTSRTYDVHMSEKAFQSIDPSIQKVLKLFNSLPNHPVVTIIGDDEVQGKLKSLGLKNVVGSIIGGVQNASYYEFIRDGSTSLFAVPMKEFSDDDLFKSLMEDDSWVRTILENIWGSYRGKIDDLTAALQNGGSDQADAKKRLAKLAMRTLFEAFKQKHPSAKAMSTDNKGYLVTNVFKVVKLGLLEEKDIDSLLWDDIINGDPEILERVRGTSTRKYENNSGYIKLLRLFIAKAHPDFIKSNPVAIGYFIENGANVSEDQVEVNADSIEKMVSNMFEIGGFLNNTNSDITSDFPKIIEALKRFKKMAKDHMRIVENYNGDLEYSVKFIGLVSAILGDGLDTEFAEAVKKNAEKNGKPDAARVFLNISEILMNEVVQRNKPLVKKIFDIVGSKFGGDASMYIKVLSKDEIKAKLKDGTLKAMVASSRQSMNLLNSVVVALKEAKNDAPTTVSLIDLMEEMFKDKRTYDKSMRDAAIDDITDTLFDLHQTDKKTADVIFSSVKGEIKRAMLDRAIGEELLGTVKKILYGEDALIKPLQQLDGARIKTMLKYNNLNIPSIRVNSPAGQSLTALEAEVERFSKVISHPKVTRSGKTDKRAEYLERKSVEYDKFNKYRHGAIAVKFMDEFDVNIPEQVAGHEKFKKKKPNTKVMNPVFHGTGSIAASMILRFGFTVISSKDSSVVGRMLGDGIYFSTVLDKVSQYVSDGGYSRGLGNRGYIFQMDALLGDPQIDYREAGTGGDNIRSPEWCVFTPNEQLKIEKAFLIEIISKDAMDKLKAKYPMVSEAVCAPITTFKEFLKESQTEGFMHTTTYAFIDGNIPVSETEYVDFDELDVSKFPANVRMEPSGVGPMIIIDHDGPETEAFCVDNTARFMTDGEELIKFLMLAYNYQPR